MILIHFSEQHVDATAVNHDRSASGLPLDCVDLVQWYCRSVEGRQGSLGVLLPEVWSDGDQSAPDLGNASVIRYSDDASLSLPKMPDGADVWIVNGLNRPIINWSDASLASDRRNCDVLIFGSPNPATGNNYSESLQVDETGQIVDFRRHYLDSSSSVDRWSGSAAYMVCAAEHARSVVGHLVVHGWGLDGVGRLTRRFHVAWHDPTLVNDSPGRRKRQSAMLRRKNGLASRANGNETRHAQTLTVGKITVDRHGVPEDVNGKASAGGTTRKLEIDKLTQNEHPVRVSQRGESSDVRLERDEQARVDISDLAPTSYAGSASETLAYAVMKRTMDIVLSVAALIITFPLMVVVAILIRLTTRGPALFGHVRQGLGGKEFRCLKFRTMIDGADTLQAQLRGDNEVDGPQFKIAQDPRLTRLGGWLRRYNIDELPQFFNVLRGEMSLVGPRPSPDGENQFCPEWRCARLSVRPGITGLWQVLRLRDNPESDFQEWIYYDLEYLKHRSMLLDCLLLLQTPASILAPGRIRRFAERLSRAGICKHTAWLDRGAEPDPFEADSDGEGTGTTKNVSV